MRANLQESLRLLLGHEGGYSDAKTDAGGPTKYGITHTTLAKHRGVKSVTRAQVKALTWAEAVEIYAARYWKPSGGDVLPAGLDYAAFDFGVNSGPDTAVETLQRTVGVRADGHIGPVTLAAVAAYPGGVVSLIRAYGDARMAYLRKLTNPQTGFAKNGRGWTRRVTGKDPKGIYPAEPGVTGHAVRIAMTAHSSVANSPAAPARPAAPVSVPPINAGAPRPSQAAAWGTAAFLALASLAIALLKG